MASKTFFLAPFEAAPEITLSINGTVTLAGTQLTIVYLLSGDLEKVAIAPDTSHHSKLGGARRDRLWEQTCFEFFLSSDLEPTEHTPYWEFNLSPSGDWNVFALDGYRQGLKEEAAISHLSFQVERSSESVYLKLETDVSDLVNVDRPRSLGVSAVVVLEDGTQTFWAIAHPGAEADFHHPKSFVVIL